MTQPPYPPPGCRGPGQQYGPPAPQWPAAAQPGAGNQGPQPYWQAAYGQAPYGQVPQGQWPQYPPPPKKSAAGRIIGVVAAVFAIPVVIAAIVGITAGIRGEPPTTATTADDFKAVCKNGSVSNAADYQKPHKVVTFYESVTGWSAVTMLGAGADYAGANLPPSSINVVACLSRRAGSEKKEGTCDYDSGGDKDRVSRYSVDYDVELREAKTGERIKSLGSVPGPSTRCPVVALYTASSHKMYGDPDKDQLNAMLKEFAAG
ncbi:hypothetical protein [Mycolicibacterium mucogenicum]|uniref:Uncharacterized protein n=1 Tax=Mycolicibacterium mucogenicum TaxID=56689 RepID=A0A4R5WJT4_MYCMU|nr:hypothetical protein [Mycolicibacterium mucogenicum]TDK90745.1 hypothetical protein EUA03_10120 [Mycolicibacterium mucogenicum]